MSRALRDLSGNDAVVEALRAGEGLTVGVDNWLESSRGKKIAALIGETLVVERHVGDPGGTVRTLKSAQEKRS